MRAARPMSGGRFCRPWYRTRPASLTDVVSSYLTFSPSPSGNGRQLFSVTVSKDYSHLRFPQQGALSCPDFPHRPYGQRDRASHLFALWFVCVVSDAAANIVSFCENCIKVNERLHAAAVKFLQRPVGIFACRIRNLL